MLTLDETTPTQAFVFTAENLKGCFHGKPADFIDVVRLAAHAATHQKGEIKIVDQIFNLDKDSAGQFIKSVQQDLNNFIDNNSDKAAELKLKKVIADDKLEQWETANCLAYVGFFNKLKGIEKNDNGLQKMGDSFYDLGMALSHMSSEDYKKVTKSQTECPAAPAVRKN